MNQPIKNQDPHTGIPENHVRYYAVGVIALVCVSFITGYYWGKKKAYEEFLERCSEDVLGDKISAALCSLYDAASDQQKEIDSDENGGEHKEGRVSHDASADNADALCEQTVSDVSPGAAETGESALYFAQLAGFGSKRSADSYALALQGRGIAAHVVTRTSKTTRGKVCTWHQVVTDPMEYNALQALVDGIKKIDKLCGVVLVEQTKETEEDE